MRINIINNGLNSQGICTVNQEKPTVMTTSAKDEPLRRLSSEELFGGQKRVIIEHDSLDYLLQITRQGKLILTK